MRLSEHRREFTRDIGKLIENAPAFGIDLAIHESGRTAYQQAKYVEDGLSWTMDSDHLIPGGPLAVDWVFYRISDGVPIWVPEYNEELMRVGAYWISLNPDLNYWGWAEWPSPYPDRRRGKDSPHMGRREQSGRNHGSKRLLASFTEPNGRVNIPIGLTT